MTTGVGTPLRTDAVFSEQRRLPIGCTTGSDPFIDDAVDCDRQVTGPAQ
jgi:hypothetical protein